MFEAIKRKAAKVDTRVSASTFGRVFRLQGSGHERERKDAKFLNEIRAGLTTFFTMAYIIAVNATLISDSGGTCICNDPKNLSCKDNTEYALCQLDVKRDLVTATAAVAGISSVAFGFLTNLPVALAPGMGLNAYFTYQVVGERGTGPVPYRLALTAVFIEGFIFVFLSLVGMRQWLVKIIPASIKVASGVGIGLFLTTIGLGHSVGIGAISGGGKATPTKLAGCPDQYIKTDGTCSSHTMQSPTMWIGIVLGGVLTSYLMAYRVKLAIVVGIACVSIVSWPRDTPFTYFRRDDVGNERFDYFKKVVGFHPISHTLAAQDWDISGAGSQFALALFTFLYVDIIDCTATLYSMARFSGVVNPETGDFPRSKIAYCTDAVCISIGSLFGVSPVTAFVESGAGVAEGGKTGLTAITTGVCFLLSVFFAPIFQGIPPWATGCTLVLVGCMMMRQVTSINWAYIGDAIPAFVTLAFMPLSYSVAYGLIAGMMAYTSLNTLIWLTKKISRGRIVPPDHDMAEYWTYKPRTGHIPWFQRAARNGGRFWEHEKPLSLDEDAQTSDFENGLEMQPSKSGSRRSRVMSGTSGDTEAITVKTSEIGRAVGH